MITVQVTTHPPLFVSLFAGAGGMALGLERAGFACVGAAEKDSAAAETFKSNFYARMAEPRILALGPSEGDIQNLDFGGWARRLQEVGCPRLDVLEGGPPCQSFSRVGRGKLNALRKGGFLSDPRNLLWHHFFEAVRILKPRIFLIENVPGMLHHGGVNVAEAICRAGIAAGYRVRCAVLNAAAFGVPQTRERLFVLGISEELGVTPSFPTGDRCVVLSPSHYGSRAPRDGLFEDPSLFDGTLLPKNPQLRSISVGEAIGDLPRFLDHLKPGYRAKVPWRPFRYRLAKPSAYAQDMRLWLRKESTILIDHVCKATPRDYDTFAAMAPGDKYPDALQIAEGRYLRARVLWQAGHGSRPRRKDYVPPYKDDAFDDKWHKLIPEEPSWTITAHLAKDTYSHIHYDSKQKRMITIREAARIQSFPDAFAFHGNIGDRFRQIGNAVPPLLAHGIGLHVLTLLDECKRNEDARYQASSGERLGYLRQLGMASAHGGQGGQRPRCPYTPLSSEGCRDSV